MTNKCDLNGRKRIWKDRKRCGRKRKFFIPAFLLVPQCLQKPLYPGLYAQPDGLVVSVWRGGCEFDTRLRWTLFPAYFRLSPLLKHVRKVVGGFGKRNCVSTGVRKPGNTCASPNAMIIMTLTVKVALNPSQPTNQPTNQFRIDKEYDSFVNSNSYCSWSKLIELLNFCYWQILWYESTISDLPQSTNRPYSFPWFVIVISTGCISLSPQCFRYEQNRKQQIILEWNFAKQCDKGIPWKYG